MLQNKHLLILIYLGVGFNAFSQTTFNQRFFFGSGPFKPSSVYVSDEFIYTYSWGLGSPLQLVQAMYDHDGVLVDSLMILDDYGTSVAVEGDGFSNTNNHIQSGPAVDSASVSVGYYQIFSNEGLPIRFHAFRNPWWSGDINDIQTQGVIPRDWYLDEIGNVMLSYVGQANDDFEIDGGVIFFNSQDEYQWHLEWIDSFDQQVYAISKVNDSYYVAVTQWMDQLVYNSQVDMYKISQEGEVMDVWDDEWEFNVTEVLEMQADEQNIVCVGSISEAEDIPSQGLIMKLDTLMNVVWWNALENSSEDYRRKFEDVTITSDGNYVATGQFPLNLEETDPVNGDELYDGWACKFDSESGELLWERFYRIIESYENIHDIFDVKASPDGGIVFCGQSINYSENSDPGPLQQGWLVKTDEYGCVIPGCQMVGVSETEVLNDAGISFGPNPLAKGEPLRVYSNYQFSPDAELGLWTMNGERIAAIHPGYAGLTTLWSIPQISSGVYLLKLIDRGVLIHCEELVIHK